jgi:hypothetical protein
LPLAELVGRAPLLEQGRLPRAPRHEHLDSTKICTHDVQMRTTVTLDADVEQLLRDAMQRRRQSFKEALNQAIRRGLSNASAGPDETPFALRARRMGLRAGIDSARLNQLSDELEAAGFEELSRRLANAHGKSPARKRR